MFGSGGTGFGGFGQQNQQGQQQPAQQGGLFGAPQQPASGTGFGGKLITAPIAQCVCS